MRHPSTLVKSVPVMKLLLSTITMSVLLEATLTKSVFNAQGQEPNLATNHALAMVSEKNSPFLTLNSMYASVNQEPFHT